MNKNTAVLAAAIAAVGIMAVHLWQELRAGGAQLSALQQEVATLERERSIEAPAPAPVPGAMPVATAAAPVDRPGSAQPAAATSAAAPAVAPATPPPQPSTTAMMAGVGAALNTPAAQDLMSRQLRASLLQQFPDLAREVGLSADETEQFLDLLARQATSMTGDAMAMMGGQAGAEGMEESARRMAEREQASDREARALLGSRYGKWEEYQGRIAAGTQVSQLRALLGSGDNALAEDKAKALTAAIGAEITRSTREYREQGASASLQQQLEMNEKQNERSLEAARDLLTSAQLQRFRAMLDQQEAMVRSVMGAMGGGAGAQPVVPR